MLVSLRLISQEGGGSFRWEGFHRIRQFVGHCPLKTRFAFAFQNTLSSGNQFQRTHPVLRGLSPLKNGSALVNERPQSSENWAFSLLISEDSVL